MSITEDTCTSRIFLSRLYSAKLPYKQGMNNGVNRFDFHVSIHLRACADAPHHFHIYRTSKPISSIRDGENNDMKKMLK